MKNIVWALLVSFGSSLIFGVHLTLASPKKSCSTTLNFSTRIDWRLKKALKNVSPSDDRTLEIVLRLSESTILWHERLIDSFQGWFQDFFKVEILNVKPPKKGEVSFEVKGKRKSFLQIFQYFSDREERGRLSRYPAELRWAGFKSRTTAFTSR